MSWQYSKRKCNNTAIFKNIKMRVDTYVSLYMYLIKSSTVSLPKLNSKARYEKYNKIMQPTCLV